MLFPWVFQSMIPEPLCKDKIKSITTSHPSSLNLYSLVVSPSAKGIESFLLTDPGNSRGNLYTVKFPPQSPLVQTNNHSPAKFSSICVWNCPWKKIYLLPFQTCGSLSWRLWSRLSLSPSNCHVFAEDFVWILPAGCPGLNNKKTFFIVLSNGMGPNWTKGEMFSCSTFLSLIQESWGLW